MRAIFGLGLLCPAAMAITSCGSGQEEAQEQTLKAGGKILERSITDDMLPYDTLRSQPPLLKPVETGSDSSSALEDEVEESDGNSVASDIEATPGENSADAQALPSDD